MNLHNTQIHAFFVWFKKSCIFAEYQYIQWEKVN